MEYEEKGSAPQMEYVARKAPGFNESITMTVSNLLRYKGRSRRAEYWWPALVTFLAYLLLPIIGFFFSLCMIPLTFRRLHDTGRSGWWWVAGAVIQVAVLGYVALVMGEGLAAKGDLLAYFNLQTMVVSRWYLYAAVLAYRVVLIVFLSQDGERGANRYGESPKYVLAPKPAPKGAHSASPKSRGPQKSAGAN